MVIAELPTPTDVIQGYRLTKLHPGKYTSIPTTGHGYMQILENFYVTPSEFSVSFHLWVCA